MKRTHAYFVFFPAVSVYGLVFLPASVYSLATGHALAPGIQTGMDHAHEMLFGYALGVATGFLLNNVPAMWIACMFSLWLAARMTYLLAPASDLADVTNILFALGFAVIGASRFLPSAKKWRNRAFAVTVIVFALAAIAMQLQVPSAVLTWPPLSVYEGVLIIALLMLLMGGRFIAPAAAGHIEKQGGSLEARVQPRLEGAIIILLLTGALGLLVSPRFAGAAMLMSGAVAAIRMLRWRLWECRDRVDLVSLGVGYAWVAIGLMIAGASLVLSFAPIAALHAITVGGIGTLTSTVMARTWLQRSGVAPADFRGFAAMTSLISIATCLRLASGYVPSRLETETLLAAALCWSGALLLLTLGVFARYPSKRRR